MKVKRLLALLMVLAMVFSLALPVTVFAEDEEDVVVAEEELTEETVEEPVEETVVEEPVAEEAEPEAEPVEENAEEPVEEIAEEPVEEALEEEADSWEDGTGNVAKIGDTGFETLEAAFAAAQDGDIIELLQDCSGNGIKVPQGKFNTNGLTVLFNNHTYTVDGETVGSTGTETNGFQLLKDNKIDFEGGTITSTKAKILVQNYSNLTLTNMTLTLNNPNYKSAYTLSNNNGEVQILNSTINSNPAGGFAFDVCRYASYPSVSVLVGTAGGPTSKINGDIEIDASDGDPKSGFSLQLDVCELTGKIVMTDRAKTAMKTNTGSITKSCGIEAALSDGYYWFEDSSLMACNDDTVAVIEVFDDNSYKFSVNEYTALAEAVAEAQDGDTITLVADVALTATQEIGKDLTINLNDHNITATDARALWVKSGDVAIAGTGTISVVTTEGTSLQTGSSVIRVGSSGTAKAELTIGSDVTVTTDYCYGITAFGTNTNGVELVVSGTVSVSGTEAAISGNGNSENKGAVTIKEGAVISSTQDAAIYHPQGDSLTIEGGTITGTTAIYQKSGTLNITGGTIKGNGENTAYTYTGDDCVTTGDAIVIDNCNYPSGAPSANIKGATINSTNGKQVGYYVNGESAEGTVLADSKYTLNTNKEKGWVADSSTEGYSYKIGEVTYVAEIGDDKYETLAAAVAAVDNNQTITLLDGIEAETSWQTVNSGKTFTIDLNGQTLNAGIDLYSGFVTLKDTAETKGKMANRVYVYGTTDSSKTAGQYNSFTLDSSATIETIFGILLTQVDKDKAYGSEITINGTILGNVWVYGNITQGNSVINVNGTVNAEGKSDIGVALNGNATVNVASGATITSQSTEGKGTGIEVRAGNLNVTGGTITGHGKPSTVTANGNGTTSTGAGIMVSTYELSNISVSISGGTISGYSPLYLANTKGTTNYDLSLSVSGGMFACTEGGANAVAMNESNPESRATGFITGGKFSSEPDSDYVASGYKAVANTDADTQATYPFTVGEKYTQQSTTSSNTTTTTDSDTTTTKTTDLVTSTSGTTTTYAIKTVTTTTESGSDATTTTTYKDVTVNTGTNATVASNVSSSTSSAKENVVAAVTAYNNNESATFKAALTSSATASEAQVLQTTAAANAIAKAAAQESFDTSSISTAKVILKTELTSFTESTSTSGNVSKVTYDITPVVQLYDAYDNTLGSTVALDNDDIEDGQTFTFNIPVPANMTGSMIKVSHIGKNGASTEVGTYTPSTADTSGVRYIEVTVDHFSEFELEEATVAINGSCKISASISLNDSIDINFYVKELADNTSASDYKVVYSFNSGTETTVLGSDWTETSTGKYGFKVASCAAKQMNDTVNFYVYYGSDTNGWTLVNQVVDYSIWQYCVNKIDANTNAKLVALCRATLDYGAAAQNYFSYNTSTLANRGNYGLTSPVTSVPETYNIANASKQSDVSRITATLNTVSQTEINIYVTTSSSSVTISSVKIGDNEVDSSKYSLTTLSDNRHMITIKGIAAANLSNEYTVTFTTQGGTTTVTYSAMAYAFNKQNSTTAGEISKALYNYYLNAEAYFNSLQS